VEDRHNRAGAGNGLRHAKDRSVGLKRVGSEAIVEQLIKRDGLRIEIEKSIGCTVSFVLGAGPEDVVITVIFSIGV